MKRFSENNNWILKKCHKEDLIRYDTKIESLKAYKLARDVIVVYKNKNRIYYKNIS